MVKKNSRKKIFNIPNILTIFRLILSPVIFYLIWVDRKNLALFLFILAVITDKADGVIARKSNQETAFGETIDPIADNSLIILTTVALVLKNVVSFYFLKYAFFILSIFIISIIILSIRMRRIKVPALILGKTNVLILYLLIIYIFLGLPVGNLFINLALIYSFIISLIYFVYSIRVKKVKKTS